MGVCHRDKRVGGIRKKGWGWRPTNKERRGLEEVNKGDEGRATNAVFSCLPVCLFICLHHYFVGHNSEPLMAENG